MNDNKQKFTHRFDPNLEGMTLVMHLNTVRDPQNQYYVIYRDQACTKEQKISYLQLSSSMGDLGLYGGMTLYVKREAQLDLD
jgi:hypothetical protein